MSTEHIAKRIDGFIRKDPDRVVDMWSRRKTERIHDLMINMLGIPKDQFSSLLDAGCGTGEICGTLSRNGYTMVDVMGFDCSSEAIKVCDKKWVGGRWVVATEPSPDWGRFDFGVVMGPFAYTLGPDKWDSFKLLGQMRAVCQHGIGYFQYTSRKNAPPGPVLTRFHPEEVQERFPNCKVIIDPWMVSEYNTDSGFGDLDKGIIQW